MKAAKIVCFIISLLWVGFGAFIQISAYPDYNYLGFDYNSSIYNVLWWITFPFNILFFTVIFFERLTTSVLVFLTILKLANVLVYWVLIHNIFKQKLKIKNRMK